MMTAALTVTEMTSSCVCMGEVCGIINCASHLDSARFSLRLAEQYDYVYAAVGIHPHEAAEASATWEEELYALAQHKKAVAIGEIGLDYHYDFSPRDVQRKVFEKQLDIAKELSLPVIIHDREAHGDMYDILSSRKDLSGVIHCFSGSVELARQTVDMGMYIGLGGAVTFKNARVPVEVAQYIPLDRLLLETDAPYMTPVPYRGKRCDSSHIALTAQKIADVKGITVDELLKVTRQNVERLFGLK